MPVSRESQFLDQFRNLYPGTAVTGAPKFDGLFSMVNRIFVPRDTITNRHVAASNYRRTIVRDARRRQKLGRAELIPCIIGDLPETTVNSIQVSVVLRC